MDLKLKGEVAVVVGGASGIGLAIGTAFAKEGAAVELLDLSPAVHESATQLARDTSASVSGRINDATDYAAVCKVVAEILSARGRIDHVVYAAGAGSKKFGFPFWNFEPSDWDRTLRINLVGAVNVAHAVVPHLTAERRGTMLFLSSVAGQIGSQTDPPYSAAKAGLINFAQCAAKDLADYNVRVNAICPGMIQTPLNRSVWQAWHDQQPENQRQSYEVWAGEKVRRVVPLKRWQEPEDVAALAVFLASAAAKNITGQTMNVDGGQVMRG